MDKSLREALEEGLDRDLQQGTTHHGPHRADLKISYDERVARKLVSRGQQKLLASAMILAATETAQAALERPLLLLLDDPAAELDGDALRRLMAAVAGLGCQVVATSLQKDALEVPSGAAMFHVEQGVLTPTTAAESRPARGLSILVNLIPKRLEKQGFWGFVEGLHLVQCAACIQRISDDRRDRIYFQ